MAENVIDLGDLFKQYGELKIQEKIVKDRISLLEPQIFQCLNAQQFQQQQTPGQPQLVK